MPLTISLKRLFWALLILWIATGATLELVNGFLETEATPYGIVSFEFCGFNNSCDLALDQWGETGQLFVMFSLGIDFLYLVVYPSFFAVCIILLQRRVKPQRVPNINMIITACGLMAITDAIENYGLIRIILADSQSPYPMISAVSASIKFSVLAIVLLWLFYLVLKNFGHRASDD